MDLITTSCLQARQHYCKRTQNTSLFPTLSQHKGHLDGHRAAAGQRETTDPGRSKTSSRATEQQLVMQGGLGGPHPLSTPQASRRQQTQRPAALGQNKQNNNYKRVSSQESFMAGKAQVTQPLRTAKPQIKARESLCARTHTLTPREWKINCNSCRKYV